MQKEHQQQWRHRGEKIIEMGIHFRDLWGRRAKFKLIQVTMVQFTLKFQVIIYLIIKTIKPKTVC